MRRKEIAAQKQQTQTKPQTTSQTQMSLPQERERERERERESKPGKNQKSQSVAENLSTPQNQQSPKNPLREFFYIWLKRLFSSKKQSNEALPSDKATKIPAKLKTIWTFWEPKNSMRGYVKLCMKTWAKFLPEYEIIVVDYSNLKEYIGDFYDESLYSNFSLPKQADAIRAALLSKYGGVWFDADTIVTSEKINEILDIDSEFVIVSMHIGFLCAKKGGEVISTWAAEAQKRVLAYKAAKEKGDKKALEAMSVYYYLGNGCLNITEFISQNRADKAVCIDRMAHFIVPEANYFAQKRDGVSEYVNFYFKDDKMELLRQSKYMIMLHNSWTPAAFGAMSETEFLNSDCVLARLLKEILCGDEKIL